MEVGIAVASVVVHDSEDETDEGNEIQELVERLEACHMGGTVALMRGLAADELIE